MKYNARNILPKKTVERLSKYRRILGKYRNLEEPHIYSHDLARMLNITSAQVRRDIMLIGFNGNHRKGYNVKELVDLIGEKILNGRFRMDDKSGLSRTLLVLADSLFISCKSLKLRLFYSLSYSS